MKPREVPISLQMRRFLRPRMSFTYEDLQQLLADEKGFEGECYFDKLMEESPASSYLQLHDLLLQWHHTTFQIDSLLLAPHKIYLFDVKNYEGEFYIEGDRWFFGSGKEVKSPLSQLQRCESLFRPLLQMLGLNLPIEANVIFVNPEFTLFQANRNLPIILPTQMKSFLERLGSVSLKSNDRLIAAAKNLATLHIDDSPFDQMRIPQYTYESLKKGILCARCQSPSVYLDGRKFICELCGDKEALATGIMRAVEEYKLLFPKRLIKVSSMLDWCGLEINRKRMQRILRDHLVMVKDRKSAFYR